MTEALLGGGLGAAITLVVILYRRVATLERSAGDRAQHERDMLQQILNTPANTGDAPLHGRHRAGGPVRRKGHLALYTSVAIGITLATAAVLRLLWQPRTRTVIAVAAAASIVGATPTTYAPPDRGHTADTRSDATTPAATPRPAPMPSSRPPWGPPPPPAGYQPPLAPPAPAPRRAANPDHHPMLNHEKGRKRGLHKGQRQGH